MFSKVLILALAAAVAHCQFISSYSTGGIPVYRTSANYGGLYAANGYGYGANLGRVAGLGALRTTGAIVGGGALGYGSGALLAGGPAIGAYKSLAVAAPAVSALKVATPAVGVAGLGLGYGVSGLGLGVGAIGARGISVHQAGPVNAAVHTIARTVDYKPVPYTGEAAVVQDIDVPPQESPLRINFQSKSSPLQVTQQHIPAEPGQVQVTQSEDEPHQLVHNVQRSVHQQVNEIVQPYRTLTQTVEPVIEQTHTNIAQGEGVRLTGLQSGVIGGTGVLAASGLGVAAPAVSTIGVAAPAISSYGVGLARPAIAGYGVKTLGLGSGVYGAGLYGSGLYGGGLYGSRLSGVYGTGLSGVYGTGLSGVYGTGLSGIYGTGLSSGLLGGYRSYGYGTGLGLNGLSGLSTYGTTSKIARIL